MSHPPASFTATAPAATGAAAGENAFSALVKLACSICATPAARIALAAGEHAGLPAMCGLEDCEFAADSVFHTHSFTSLTPFAVADTRADQRFAAEKLVCAEPGLRFYACAPIVAPSGGEVLGRVSVWDRRTRELSAEQLAALLDIARLAALCLEERRQLEALLVARCAELKENLCAQEAAAHELEDLLHEERAARRAMEEALRLRSAETVRFQSAQLALAKMSELELALALRRICELSAVTIGVERVSVWLFDVARTELICHDLFRTSRNSHETGLRLPVALFPRYIAALESQLTIAAEHALAAPETAEFAGSYLRPAGIVSMLDVPIRRRGQVVGVVCHEQIHIPRRWTLEEEEFAAAVAAAVALALEEEERRGEHAATVHSQRRLKLTVETAKLGVWEFDPRTGIPFHSPEWARLLGIDPEAVRHEAAEFFDRLHPADRGRVEAAFAAALASAQERWIDDFRIRHESAGWRWMTTRAHIFRDENGAAARVVGVTFDVTEHKQIEVQLRALASRAEAIREQERASLARELHDGLGQLLTAARLEAGWLERRGSPGSARPDAEAAERAGALKALLDQCIALTQRVSSELRSTVLEELGLVAALEEQAAQFESRAGTPCIFEPPEGELALGPQPALALFRIFQELLTNILRHARASRVHTRLGCDAAGVVTLSVRDDGCGIPPNRLTAEDSLGLLGIRERVGALGGRVVFETGPGRGTTATITLPAAP